MNGITDAIHQATQTATGGSSASPGGAVAMIVVLTLVTLLPAIILSCTCFVRFIVVLGFVRTGMGTASAPPNQVLVGLALFMSIFVSAPVAMEMYEKGGKAYMAGLTFRTLATDKAARALKAGKIAGVVESGGRIVVPAREAVNAVLEFIE